MAGPRKSLTSQPEVMPTPASRLALRLGARLSGLRETGMLWAVRAAMLAYALAMVAVAEAAAMAFRRLF